jgi:hypothetical protein
LRTHGGIYLNHYAEGRIIFKAKGSDSKFGALQALATATKRVVGIDEFTL